MASVQDVIADVSNRLESLKAALSEKAAGGEQEASQLAAIKRMAQELEALLEPAAGERDEPARQQEATAAAVTGVAAPPAAVSSPAGNFQQQQQYEHRPAQNTAADPAAGNQDAECVAKMPGVPATPFDQRKPAPEPAVGPATAAKAAPTPGGGAPATTPLAAEVLASLNHLGGSSSTAAKAAPAVVAAADQADGDAAATLRSLDLLPSAAASNMQQQLEQEQADGPAAAALASILQEAALMPLPPPAQAAAMAAAAAAAAAGPAVPVLRRQAAGMPALAGSQMREMRPCNCKRSMCLKMYCECFASGGFCAPTCSCLNCSNNPRELEAVQAAREVVLAKNPHAFEVKVTATDGHKRGCRCKRSKCLKKYCECFHAGARCNPDVCQCEDCRNTEGDAMLGAVLGRQAWGAAADTTADVLAMFQQPLPMPMVAPSGGSDSSGSAGGMGHSARGSGARRGKARAQQLPLPALGGAPASSAAAFPFNLPPMPDPTAFASASAPAAAAMLGGFSAAAMFAAPVAAATMPAFDQAATAFMLNPVAAAAAALNAAAATMAEQPQVEESMADAVSCPARAAAAPLEAVVGLMPSAAADGAAVALAGTPGAAATAKMGSALTSHLSDVAGVADSDMHDTATSPAPHMALATLAARRNLIGSAAATLTGGPAGLLSRPPLPHGRVRALALTASADSQHSLGSVDENGGDSINTAASQRSKRPRRAASGGVLGAVAAEAADWGLEMVSPPLKRANSLPAVPEVSKGRGKVSDRVALLKKALAADSAQQQLGGCAAGAALPLLPPPAAVEADCTMPTAEDADAISALFELSSSVC